MAGCSRRVFASGPAVSLGGGTVAVGIASVVSGVSGVVACSAC